ncbi:MAG: hypothetical protein QXJ68_01570 [Methanocellales archaeon]
MNWRIALFLALFAFTLPYICKSYSAPIEMESQQSAKLYWGDKANFRNYTIEAADFTVSGDIKSVKLKLYKDGVYLDQRIMNVYPSNHWNYNGEDEIWIDVSNVYIEPPNKAYVDLYVTLRGLPELSIEVTTDANSYKANRYIQVTVKVKNTGSDSPGSYKGARAGDVKLNIDTSGMQVIMGETTKSYSEIKRGEQVPDILLTLNAPSLLNKTTLYINVTATGYDAKNISYTWSGSKAIEIESMIEIIKLVSGSVGYLTPTPTETGIYMDETSGVTVVIRNHGSFPVYDVVINDSLLSEFKLKSGQTNMKIDVLEPGVEKERLIPFYVMIPLKPGTYTLPKATANFTYNGVNYSIESEEPKLIVHGPYIELTKTADNTVVKNGSRINITITAMNSGDRTCAVNISDEIPLESTKLINGSLVSNTLVLKAGESASLKYEIEIITNRSFTLPQATSTYMDIKNYRAIAKSSTIAITNLDEVTPTPTSLPTQTPTPPQPTPTRRVAPGFEVAIAVIAILALVYILKGGGRR